MKQYIKYICLFLMMGMSTEIWGATIVFKIKDSGDGSTTYVNSETEQTSGTYKYKMNHWNPSSGQTRGNQSTASDNFYMYNTTAIPGSITKIEFFERSGSYTETKAYYVLGSSECTSSSSGTAFSSSATTTWTASVTGTNTYFRVYFTNGATSSTCCADSIRITYTAASPRTVTFNAEGGTCLVSSRKEDSGGAGVVLPEATADCSSTGWGFYGWATSAQSTSTTTAPTIVGKAGDRYYPAADIPLHAVYAKGEFTLETSTITAGNYLIVGVNSGDNYVMSNTYSTYEDSGDDYGQLAGIQIDESNTSSHKYSAADVPAYCVFSIVTASSLSVATGNWMIKNKVDNKYVSVDYASDLYLTWEEMDAGIDGNNITYNSDGWNILNAAYNGLYFDDSNNQFYAVNDKDVSDLLLYKETTTATYWSSPICKTVTLAVTPAGGGTATFDENSSTTMSFGDNYTGDITATPTDGWDFVEWTSSDEDDAVVTDAADPTTEVYAENDATITAHFYRRRSLTYTLTGVTKESGPTAITKTEKDGFTATFSINDHYKSPVTCSVTEGGSPLTEDTHYTWDGEELLVDHDNIDGDIVITITATAKTYTDYRFSCAELTLTAKPVTAGAPIFITSAASKKVRSQDSILIVGNGLTPSASVTFPSLDGTKFEVKSRLGGNFTTKADGTIDTVAYIFYTPDAGDTSDGLDKLVGITASVGGAKPKTATLTQDIIGRHLPNKIVIAAKGSDNKWYALGSYMSDASSYNVSPDEISVDDVDNPSVAYSSTTNRYNGIEGPTLTGVGNNLASGNSQYVRLIMDIHSTYEDSSTPYAPLYGQSGDGTKVGRNGTALPTSNLSAGFWWLLTQTNTSITNPQDAKYQIKCANNAKLLRLWEAAGGVGNPKWGLYASGISELRLIPMEDGVEFAEAYMIEWGQHGAIVEVDAQGIFATKVSATIGDGEESAKIALVQTGTSVSNYTTKYNYTVNFGDGIDFAADESNGAQLTLKWYDSYDALRGVSNIIIPKIIASTNATMSTITTNEAFWNTEVHVLPGDTLFADAGSFSSSDVTIKNLQIYPGATVKVTSGTLDVTNLSLRNGWTRVGSKRYDAARLQIKSTANLTHTNAYVDLYIDNDQFYPLAVPFPVTVSNIKYVYSSRSFSVGGTTGEVRLRYYDGASRAAGKSGNWKYYGAAESLDVPTTLLPSMGYAIAVKRPSGKAFSVLRLPLTFDNAWTTGGEKGHYTDGSSVTHYKDTVRVFAYGKNAEIQECNKGWNLIGNPYMAVFHGDNSEDGIYGKILAVTNKDDEKGEKVRYITIPNSSFTDYTQVNFKDGSLNPGSSFLIQAKDTSRLEFSNAKIDVPSAPARYTATPTAAPEQEVYIRLSNENSNDVMGLVIGEDYTAAYETNADLMKMLGELNTLKTFMIYDSLEMAYLAINEQLAQEWIPVTVRIPSTGEYTYSMTGMSEIEDLEGVYLIDYTNNVVTNLIENNYSFMATEGTIAGRFAINAIVGQHNTPTDIDIINAGGDIHSDKPVKFIWNDKVFILHNGIIYDSTGKKVREIKK